MIQDNFISVVVPTYNRANSIDRCLNSLFKQSYPSSGYEVIVVDDKSHDDTPKVLRKYSKKHSNLKVLRNKQNKGSSYCRNSGARAARGRIVAFTDSDCIPSSDWLQKIDEAFQNATVLCVQGTQENRGRWPNMWEGSEYLRLCKERRALDTKNLAIIRDLFLQYKFKENFRSAEDWDLALRLSEKVRIVYDSSLTVVHVTNDFWKLIAERKERGKARAYLYEKYGWKGTNPKFKFPILVLFFYYLGAFFYLLLRHRTLRAAIVHSVNAFLTAFHFKSNIDRSHIKL